MTKREIIYLQKQRYYRRIASILMLPDKHWDDIVLKSKQIKNWKGIADPRLLGLAESQQSH